MSVAVHELFCEMLYRPISGRSVVGVPPTSAADEVPRSSLGSAHESWSAAMRTGAMRFMRVRESNPGASADACAFHELHRRRCPASETRVSDEGHGERDPSMC